MSRFCVILCFARVLILLSSLRSNVFQVSTIWFFYHGIGLQFVKHKNGFPVNGQSLRKQRFLWSWKEWSNSKCIWVHPKKKTLQLLFLVCCMIQSKKVRFGPYISRGEWIIKYPCNHVVQIWFRDLSNTSHHGSKQLPLLQWRHTYSCVILSIVNSPRIFFVFNHTFTKWSYVKSWWKQVRILSEEALEKGENKRKEDCSEINWDKSVVEDEPKKCLKTIGVKVGMCPTIKLTIIGYVNDWHKTIW